MTAPAVIDPVAQAAAVRAAVARGGAHVAAETSNDLDAIMATVSRQPWFPLLDHDGAGGLALDVRTTPDQVRDYYASRGTGYDIVASRAVQVLSSDWFTFRESVATLRHVGDVAGVAATGREFHVNSAVLFPVAPDGIGGEIVWTRYPFGDVLTGSVVPPRTSEGPAHLPGPALRNARTHDAFVEAWRGHDLEGIGACLSDDVHWLGRRWSDDGRASHRVRRGRAACVAAFDEDRRTAAVRDVEVFTRIVSDWYVLAEYRVHLAGGATPLQRRMVALYPVDDEGRLRAEMSEQRDLPRGGR